MPPSGSYVSILHARRSVYWAAAVQLPAVLGLSAASGLPQEPEPLVVLAASSLQDVLPAVAEAWQGSRDAPVRFSFDATSRLAPQVFRGAPADVFISADLDWMGWLEERRSVVPASVRPILTNRLVLAVPSGAFVPLDPQDLEDPRVGRIALAGEDVPVGRYARAALELAGVWERIQDRVIRGGSARGTLEWVARHEADAGVVYRTDALAASRVRIAFEFPSDGYPQVVYPGAVAAGSGNPRSADAFLDFLGGPEAQAIFARSGFGPADALQADAAAPGAPERRFTLSPASAVRLSLFVAFGAVLLGLVPAVAVGWVLARSDFFGKTFVSMVFMAPLVIPPVVTGFLLLAVLGRQSVVGGFLDAIGLPVPFTILGATLAALVVGFPLYVMAVRGAFESVDRRYEEVSWTLGVPRAPTFRRISLPLALPGIAAGSVLAFARALGEFGATVVLAGNLEGETRTIALAIYSLLESPTGRGAAWTLAVASVVLSFVALFGFESLSRWQRRRLEDHRER